MQKTHKGLSTGSAGPHFQDRCLVWGCTVSTESNPLHKLQHGTARMLTNGSFDTPKQTAGRLQADCRQTAP